jgi:hypothetical protein
MPADDLVLNVKQIAGYTPAGSAPNTASLLMQLAGLGSAYASISPQALVGTALGSPGADMAIGGQLDVQAVQGGAAQFSNAAIGLLSAPKATIGNLAASFMTVGGSPVATQADLAATVTSFNGRTGGITLWINDILAAGGAPIFSPVFGGCPRAPTPDESSNNSRLATTAFVQRNAVIYIQNLLDEHPFVFTFNGRSGEVVLTEQDILAAGGGTVFDSVALTGIPTAPTAPVGTNTTQIATTAFVVQAFNANTTFAPLNSPDFIGFPSGPTAPLGTSTGQLATTAFVMNAVSEATAGVASFNTRTGAVTLLETDIIAAGGAILASPAFTGTPTAPTAAPGTANTQIATTAFVAALGAVSSFNARTGAVVLTTADITGVGGAPLASPALTGNPTAPTPAPGDSDTSIATTAYVMAAIAAGTVYTFNGRSGAVQLNSSDISAAGGAPSVSPAFTGTPSGPTAAPGTNTTQLATTAYVMAALAAGGGVLSFNGRAGAVTLTTADITAAGGALQASLATYLPLAGGTLTGALTLPATAASGNQAIRYTQVANLLAGYLPLAGGTLTGLLQIVTTNNSSGVFVVNGSFPPSISLGVSTGGASSTWSFDPTAANMILSYGATWLRLQSDGSFAIFSNLAYKPGGGSWTAPSDDRIKTVTGDYDKGLDEVLALRPVEFVYLGNDTQTADVNARVSTAPKLARASAAPFPGSEHYEVARDRTPFVGFVAQELEAIFPAMVSKRAGFIDGRAVSDLRSVNVSDLVYALVNAVKTLAARVAALEAA